MYPPDVWLAGREWEHAALILASLDGVVVAQRELGFVRPFPPLPGVHEGGTAVCANLMKLFRRKPRRYWQTVTQTSVEFVPHQPPEVGHFWLKFETGTDTPLTVTMNSAELTALVRQLWQAHQ